MLRRLELLERLDLLGSAGIRANLAERKIEAVIPGRSNRRMKIEHDRRLYKQRNRIERMFDLLPAGVLNIVNGFGVEAGTPLASSKRISKIAFTG